MLTATDLPRQLNKIMVFGLPGSGKSTFATKLAQFLGLPIHHLDRHFYIENWVERDYQEFLDIQQSFVSQPKWVIDGNAMKSLEMRFQKADVAIYFHYPILICLWRMIKRVFHTNWHIPDLAEGCTKSVRFRLINPQKLVDTYAGTGKKYGSHHPGKPGYKEDIDFLELIGYAVDESTGTQTPTTWGRIHYAKDGVHIVPIRPRG